MQGNDRQLVGWDGQRWQRVDQTVGEVFERVPWVRRILPEGPAPDSSYAISVPKLESPATPGQPVGLRTGDTQVPVHIKHTLRLKPEQLDDDDAIVRLVRTAATRVAQGEDAVLLLGKQAKEALEKLCVVSDDNLDAAGGLIDAATTLTVDAKANPIEVVAGSVAALEQKGFFGTYAAVLSNADWRDASVPLNGMAVPQMDLIQHALGTVLVADSPYVKDAIRAVVVCRDEWGYDLVVAQKPWVGFEGWDQGNLILRVEERFLLRIIDGRTACVASRRKR